MDRDQFSFVVYMIHVRADRWKVVPAEVYQALKKSACPERYLLPNYDILHTQSSAYIVRDIEEYLKAREVKV